MPNVVSLLWLGCRRGETVPVRSAVSVLSARVGDIGPVRKEIVFEPLPAMPPPAEQPVEAPDRPAEEPVPAQP